MLVLTRKPGEQIRIGQDIVLTILEIKGNRVRLGIDAPAEICVTRAELTDKGPAKDEFSDLGKPLSLRLASLQHAN